MDFTYKPLYIAFVILIIMPMGGALATKDTFYLFLLVLQIPWVLVVAGVLDR